MRLFILLLAVVVAVLAFLMENMWLYALAAVLLVAALAMLGTHLWRARKKAEKPYASARSREDELSALGIVEIRPKEKKRPPSAVEKPSAQKERAKEPSARPVSDHPTPRNPQKRSERADPIEKAERTDDRTAAPAETVSPGATERAPRRNGIQKPAPAQPVMPTEPTEAPSPFLASYLRAVQAALGAHTVCLLAQEDLALEYRIEAIVSPHKHRPQDAVFSTPEPLLTANMSRRSVALAEVGSGGVPADRLGYYAGAAPAVRQVALAPLPRSDDAATCFLLADALDGFPEAQTRALLPRFAELLARVLDTRPSGDEAPAASRKTPAAETAPDPLPVVPAEAESGEEALPGEEIRAAPSRRQIVAEEMEKARADAQELALALVYLNRAEAVAEQGGAAVEAAEEELHARLQEAAPEARVELFGELTYGIFRREPVAEVEKWAMRLQNELADATGTLEGGVSIGLAMLRQRHESPDAFRKDATDALHEAYASGTCTILE